MGHGLFEVVVLVAVLVVVAMLAARRFRGLPSRRVFVRHRRDDVEAWRATYGSAQLAKVEVVLAAVCDALLLDRADVWRLRPQDKLRAAYESTYPEGVGLSEPLELEVFLDTLHRLFGIPKSELREIAQTDPTIGEITVWCLRPRP
jgi:hypothetical protein